MPSPSSPSPKADTVAETKPQTCNTFPEAHAEIWTDKKNKLQDALSRGATRMATMVASALIRLEAESLEAAQQAQSAEKEIGALRKQLDDTKLELKEEKIAGRKIQQELDTAKAVIQDLVQGAAEMQHELDQARVKINELSCSSRFEAQLTSTTEKLRMTESDLFEAKTRIVELSTKPALHHGSPDLPIGHMRWIDSVRRKKPLILKEMMAFKARIDLRKSLQGVLVLRVLRYLRKKSKTTFDEVAKLLHPFFLQVRNHPKFSKIQTAIRRCVLFVEKYFRQWCAKRDLGEKKMQLHHRFDNLKGFRNEFLRLRRGSDKSFTCHHSCAGEVIRTVQDFLSHFSRFHMNELGLLHEDVLKHILQPHFQTAIFAECEYDIQEKKGITSKPASSSPFHADVNTVLGLAKATIDDLAKASATMVIVGKTAEDLLLKNKRLETNLKAVSDDLRAKIAKLQGSERKIGKMTHCYNVGTAICSRKMQKQLLPKDQDQDIMERGDSMAHHGTVIADFSLFYLEEKNENIKPNRDAFVILYGVSPEIASRFFTCQRFIQMLDMRGSMKAYKGKIYEKTSFNTRFLSCISHIQSLLSAPLTDPEAINAMDTKFKNEPLVSDLRFLQKEYQTAKEENQAYHRRRIY